MSANRWQRRLFQHAADLWKPDRAVLSDGEIGAATWEKVYSSLPCHRFRPQATPQDSSAEDFGRADLDLWAFWFATGQPAEQGWIVVFRSGGADAGSAFWVSATPRAEPDQGRRACGHVALLTFRVDPLPDEIIADLAG